MLKEFKNFAIKLNKLKKKQEEKAEEKTDEQIQLLTEIRNLLKAKS